MTITDTTTETVWSRALAELREKGWTKGGAAFDREATCLVLAVVHQGGINYGFEQLHDAVGTPFQARSEQGVGALYQWNDTPERTFEEVEEVLLRLHNKELEEGGE